MQQPDCLPRLYPRWSPPVVEPGLEGLLLLGCRHFHPDCTRFGLENYTFDTLIKKLEYD